MSLVALYSTSKFVNKEFHPFLAFQCKISLLRLIFNLGLPFKKGRLFWININFPSGQAIHSKLKGESIEKIIYFLHWM